MAKLSVNDHLEGILSEFEALKRSFDSEDVDSLPSSTTSLAPPPVSPSSSNFFLTHSKDSEGQGGLGQYLPVAFNNNNSLGTSPHHSHISSNSSNNPVQKSCAVLNSLSFNPGTISKPAIFKSSSSVTRAVSFQKSLNPKRDMLSGKGSDNDSFHSSSSNLDFSGSGLGALTLTKQGSGASPLLQGEYYHTQCQFQQQHLERSVTLGRSHNSKTFSSHGDVFHSEMGSDQGSGMIPNVPEPMNHDVPCTDLPTCGDGGNIVSVKRLGSRHRMSPVQNTKDNVSCNGCILCVNFFAEEDSKNLCHQQRPYVLKTPQPKAKEATRLNKFPLDLESLESSANPISPIRAERGSLSPIIGPSVQRTEHCRQHTSLPSSSASPSASPSRLCGHCVASVTGSGHTKMSLSTLQSTPLENPSDFGVPQEVPTLTSPDTHSKFQSFEDGEGDVRDSVHSILQRIASFSQLVNDTIPVLETQPHTFQSHGGLSFMWNHAKATPPLKQGMNNHEEFTGELERDLVNAMEDRKEKESDISGPEQGDEGNSQEPSTSMNAQNSIITAKGNCVAVYTKVEENMKKMEEGEKKEIMDLEARMTMEQCQFVPGLQMSYIGATDLFGYVGIEAVLDQMRSKTMKAGFEFNVMVVGQSGLGKSTLVNTLFKSKVSRKSCTPNYDEAIGKTVKLHTISHVIEENGVKMKLTVIDTPGFGDQINNENCWEPIVKYVNEQYENYLREELHVIRKKKIPDSRVHCCIYFLPATGHRLRPIDVEFMRRLGKIVSIVPVIAKADTLTIEERQEFKERIRQDLSANGIHVYPLKEYDEDPEECLLNDKIRESIPFAVVGTDKEHQVNGNKVLGRKTKWGIIEVENVAHCEFANLRDLLIRSHLQDLKDVTHSIYYEAYRVHRLNESNVNFYELSLSPWLQENGNGVVDKCKSESQL